MNNRAVLCWITLVMPFSSFAAEVAICPSFETANSRLQARAQYLIANWNDRTKARVASYAEQQAAAGAQISPDGFQLAIALYSVIAARAREEARIWLVEQLADRICTVEVTLPLPPINPPEDPVKVLTNPRFPNTCGALASRSDYPGASLNIVRTGLRRDVYSLPACYAYLQEGSAAVGIAGGIVAPDVDDEIDPYLFEALLVGVYLRWDKEAKLDPNLPQLGDIQPETLARLLAAVVTARLRTEALARTMGCMPPSTDQLRDLAKRLESLLKSEELPATPEAVMSFIVSALEKWECGDALALKIVSSTYSNVVRGNYVEAALEAATFLCDGSNPEASRDVCARLPLLGEVASAQTTEEMSAALDRVISPVGAWKRKQSEPVWSLTSMVGATLGQEELKLDTDTATHGTAGLYAPLGVERSFPARKSTSRLGGYALGFTVLDGGALLTYAEEDELGGGETSSTAESDLSSIVSPGVYFAVAIKNSPFRVGISLSRTPELRSVDFGEVEETVDSKRLALFFAVDVTLFSFSR